MREFVTYIRVSTQKQGGSGLGMEAQRRDIALYLGMQAGPVMVVGDFSDVESGAHSDRPGMDAALEMARDRGATLLVAKLDRLSRRVSFIAALMEDRALSIAVAQMPYADKFQLHIYAALAEQERDFISARTKAAMAVARDRGVKLGGLRPATAARNDLSRRAAVEREERYRGILIPLRDAGWSPVHICDKLNKDGVDAPLGGVWSVPQVARAIARLAA